MDAFVCLDVHHDRIVSILSEKYMCTHHNPDDPRGHTSHNACNIMSMMCRKPVVLVYRHVDTSTQMPKNLSMCKRVLFTVKSSEIPRELVTLVGGLHNMYLCNDTVEECDGDCDGDGDGDGDGISYVQSGKKSAVSLSKCRTWSDVVSFVNTKPKYRKEFVNDFLFISVCIDVSTNTS